MKKMEIPEKKPLAIVSSTCFTRITTMNNFGECRLAEIRRERYVQICWFFLENILLMYDEGALFTVGLFSSHCVGVKVRFIGDS